MSWFVFNQRILSRDGINYGFFTLLMTVIIAQFLVNFLDCRLAIPWGDTLDSIKRFRDLSPLEFIFTFTNEHPTFLPNLISWIDLSLGYPSLAISSLLTLALYGCLFAVIAAIVMRSHASEGNLITVLLLALVFFSSYRLVFLSIPVNNSHILVNLFASFAIISFSFGGSSQPTGRLVVLGVLFGLLASVTMANGILVLPVLALLYLLKYTSNSQTHLWAKWSLSPSAKWSLAFAISAIIFFIFWLEALTFSRFFLILEFFMSTLSLPITGFATYYEVGLALSVIQFSIAAFYFLRIVGHSRRTELEILALGFFAFTILSLLAISFARVDTYSDFFNHGHRYSAHTVLFQVGLVLCLSSTLTSLKPQLQSPGIKYGLTACVTILFVFCNHVIGTHLSSRKHQFHSIAFELAANQDVDRKLFEKLSFYRSLEEAEVAYSIVIEEFPQLRTFLVDQHSNKSP